MSYYANIASPLRKEDFDWAIKEMKKSKIKYPNPSSSIEGKLLFSLGKHPKKDSFSGENLEKATQAVIKANI